MNSGLEVPLIMPWRPHLTHQPSGRSAGDAGARQEHAGHQRCAMGHGCMHCDACFGVHAGRPPGAAGEGAGGPHARAQGAPGRHLRRRAHPALRRARLQAAPRRPGAHMCSHHTPSISADAVAPRQQSCGPAHVQYWMPTCSSAQPRALDASSAVVELKDGTIVMRATQGCLARLPGLLSRESRALHRKPVP